MSKTIKELLEEVFDNRMEQITEDDGPESNVSPAELDAFFSRLERQRQSRRTDAGRPDMSPGQYRALGNLTPNSGRPDSGGPNLPMGQNRNLPSPVSGAQNARDRNPPMNYRARTPEGNAGEAEAKDFKALQDKRTSEFKTANPIMKPGTSQFNLRMGSKGESVTDLQNRLRTAGFDPGKSDGIFGAKTAAAVKAFQDANKLKVDSIAGNQTMSALRQSEGLKKIPSQVSAEIKGTPNPAVNRPDAGGMSTPKKLNNSYDLNASLIDAFNDVVSSKHSNIFQEAKKKKLHPNQKQLDKNNNGELDSEDFRMLRNEEDTSKDYTTGVGKPEYSKEKPHYAHPNEHGATRGKKDDRENSSKHKKNSPLPTKEMMNKEKMITASYNKEEFEQIDEAEMMNIDVGEKVRLTNPKAPARHTVLKIKGQNVHIKKDSGEEIVMPLNRIKKVKYKAMKEEVESIFSEEEALIWGSEASLKAYDKKLQDKMVQKGLKNELDRARAKVPDILSQVEAGTKAMRRETQKYKDILNMRRANRGEKPIEENNEESIFSEAELAYFEAMAVAPTPEDHAPNITPKNNARGGKGKGGLSEAKAVGIANHPKPIPHQTRNMRSFGDIGLDNMVTLQHPETKEKVKVNVKHVHAFNKAYFGSSKPAEKEAHLKNFVEKVFGKGSSKSQVYSGKDKSVSLAGKNYGDKS